jgi:outer membrane murein-binding lipoprotein Lpp
MKKVLLSARVIAGLAFTGCSGAKKEANETNVTVEANKTEANATAPVAEANKTEANATK